MKWEKKTIISEMINNIKAVVKFQYDNLIFAIYIPGDYNYTTGFPTTSIRPLKLVSKNKHCLIKKYFKLILSNCGNTTVPTNLRTATNPGSKKQIRANHTISNKKQFFLIEIH